jgi:hypothetical protein
LRLRLLSYHQHSTFGFSGDPPLASLLPALGGIALLPTGLAQLGHQDDGAQIIFVFRHCGFLLGCEWFLANACICVIVILICVIIACSCAFRFLQEIYQKNFMHMHVVL